MTPAFTECARGEYAVEVECAPAEKAKSLAEPHDVILLAAILEHLYTPVETLLPVRRSLQPGGLIFFDVPHECPLTASRETRPGGSDFDLDRPVVLCQPSHAQTDPPYAVPGPHTRGHPRG